MTIPINQYCKNTHEYNKDITKHTAAVYAQLCAEREKLKQEGVLSSDSSNPLFIPFSMFGKGVAITSKLLGKAIEKMLMTLLTPQGMGMLGTILGVTFTAKAMVKFTSKILTNFKSSMNGEIGDMIIDSVSRMIDDGFSEILSNIVVVIGAFVGEAIMGLAYLGAESILFMIEAASTYGNVLMLVQLIAMVLGMMMDEWDPCSLKDQKLDASSLQMFVTGFNDGFQQYAMASYASVNTTGTTPVIMNTWPVEYTADRFLLYGMYDDLTNPKTGQTYKDLQNTFIMQYIRSLKFNSLGQEIDWPKKGDGNALTHESFDYFVGELSLWEANYNTVVANWIYKHWPIIVMILILILIFIFLVIK